MNADQNKAMSLALDILRKTTEEFTSTDAWTDADLMIWRKANPPQDQMDRLSREFLADSDKLINHAPRMFDGDTPFSMRKGVWGIVEDAIDRRGFFQLWRSILGEEVTMNDPRTKLPLDPRGWIHYQREANEIGERFKRGEISDDALLDALLTAVARAAPDTSPKERLAFQARILSSHTALARALAAGGHPVPGNDPKRPN